jgi:hypothetical protein
MCKKLTCLAILSFVLSIVLAGIATAADPSLVAWYRFDGDVTDSSGNDLHGTEMGNPTYETGVFGQAISLDGDGDYVDCGLDPKFDITDFITFTYWIKVVALDKEWNTVLSRGDDSWRSSRADFNNFMEAAVGGTSGNYLYGVTPVDDGQWHHIAAVYDGTTFYLYADGELDASEPSTGQITASSYPLYIGDNSQATGRFWNGLIDDVMIFNRALSQEEIQDIMLSSAGSFPVASSPSPEDGALHPDTWVSLSWKAGDFAVSHDVYMGENFDDVNDGTGDTFRGNQGDLFYIAGFPGFAYPDGLVNGKTYYWRIDEVNDANTASPWKGPVWSFTVPPKTAYYPEPADGTESVDLNVVLSWTAGFGARLHTVYFGENFDEVDNATGGLPLGVTKYTPDSVKFAKTYYWRVDENDGFETHKGHVWSFTTLGAVSGPNPADGALGVKPSVVLGWDAGAVAASHEVYFGTDADAVANATTASPEYKGPKALGEESYKPGKLTFNTAYYWRIDEVNSVNPDSPWAGKIWSFTTGDFIVIDDFEDYDAADNQIWHAWHDGLGYGAFGTPDFFGGNGTGAAVGDETTASYTEETIVNGGSQSMPISYDNNKQGYSKYSQVEFTLTDQRDWTEQGVANLSLWFRGYTASTGSFVEGPVGTYTMTASGTDIWETADEYHYAYKTLTGVGTIQAKVLSVDNTNSWAKAGVMIRESLDPGSVHASMVVTPANGVSFQRRPIKDAVSTSANSTTLAEAAPYWVKIERDLAGNFTAYSSANGSTWQMLGIPENIQMSANVYIGLAVTSHDAAQTCQAVFSNVTFTGNVGPQWANQDIGIRSNDAEPMYVALSNSAGTPAVVVHDDPAAAQIGTWTEWVIPLQAFADQGIVLTNVDMIAIGLGTKGNITIPGGSGKIFIDDIRLTKPAPEPEPQP